MQGLEDKDIRYSPPVFRRKIARKSRLDSNVDFSPSIILEANNVNPKKNLSSEFDLGVDEGTSGENLFQKNVSTLTNSVFQGVEETTQTDQMDKVCLSVNSCTQTGKEASSSSRPYTINEAKVQNRGRSTVKIAVSKKKYGLREKKAKFFSNGKPNPKGKQKKVLPKSDQGPYKLRSPEKKETRKYFSQQSWETRHRNSSWSRSKSCEYLLESLPEPKIGQEGTDSRRYTHLVENHEVSDQGEPVGKRGLDNPFGNILCSGGSLTSKPMGETYVKKDESTMTNCAFQGAQKKTQTDKSQLCPLIVDSSTQTGMKVASSTHPIFQFIPESGRSEIKEDEYKTVDHLTGKRPRHALTERSEKKGKRSKKLPFSKVPKIPRNAYVFSSESWLKRRPRNTPWSRSKSRECLLYLPPQPKSSHEEIPSARSKEVIENIQMSDLAKPVEKPGLVDHVRDILGSVENITPICIEHVADKIGHRPISTNLQFPDGIKTAEGPGYFDQTQGVDRTVTSPPALKVAEASLICDQTCADNYVSSQCGYAQKTGFNVSTNLTSTPTSDLVRKGLEPHTAGVLSINKHCIENNTKNFLLPDPILSSVHPNVPPPSHCGEDNIGSIHHHQSVNQLSRKGDKKLHKLDILTDLHGSKFSICPDIEDPVKSNETSIQRENDISLLPDKPSVDSVGINVGKERQLSFRSMKKTGGYQTEGLKAYMQRKKLETKKLKEVETKLAEEDKLRKQKNLERLDKKRKKLAEVPVRKLVKADRLKSTSERPPATDTFKKKNEKTYLQVAPSPRLKTVSPRKTSPEKAVPLLGFHTTPTQPRLPVSEKSNRVPIKAEDMIFKKSLRSYTPNNKHVSLSAKPKQKMERMPSAESKVFTLEMPNQSTKELYSIFQCDTTTKPLALSRGDCFLATSSQKELNQEPYRPRHGTDRLFSNEFLRRDDEIRKLQSENQESGYSLIHSIVEGKVCLQVSSISVNKTVSKNIDSHSNFSVEIKKMEKVLHAFKRKFETKQEFNLNQRVNPKDLCNEEQLSQTSKDTDVAENSNQPFFCTELCAETVRNTDKGDIDVKLNGCGEPSQGLKDEQVNTPESGRDIVDQRSEIELFNFQKTKNRINSSESIVCSAVAKKNSVINDIDNILDAIKRSSSSLNVSADTENTPPEKNISAKVSLLKRDLKLLSSFDHSSNSGKVKLNDQKKSEDSILLDKVVNSNDCPQVSKDFCTPYSLSGIQMDVVDQQGAEENPVINISIRGKVEATLNTPSSVDLVTEETELNQSNQERPLNSSLLDRVSVPYDNIQISKEFRDCFSPNASKSSQSEQQIAHENLIDKLSQINRRESSHKLLNSTDYSLTTKKVEFNSNKEGQEDGILLDKTKMPNNYSQFSASHTSNELKRSLVKQEAFQQNVSQFAISKENITINNKLDNSNSSSSSFKKEDEIVTLDKTLSAVRKDSLLFNDESTKLSVGTTISEGPLESTIQNYTNTFLDVQPIYPNRDDSYSSDFDENTSRGLSSLSLSTISQVDTERLPVSRSTSPDLAPSCAKSDGLNLNIKSGSSSRKIFLVSSPVKDVSSGSRRTKNRESLTANRNQNNISYSVIDFDTINAAHDLKTTSLKLPSQEDVSRDAATSSQSNHAFTYLKDKGLQDRIENNKSYSINNNCENLVINSEGSCFSVNSSDTKHINGADDVCALVPSQSQINYVAVQNYSPLVTDCSRLYSDYKKKTSNVLQDIATQMPSRRNSSTHVAVQADMLEDCKLNLAVKQILDASQRVEKAARGLFLLPDFQSSCTSLQSITDDSVESSETGLFSAKLEKLLDHLPLEHGQLIREEIRQHLLLLQYEWSTKKNLAKDELKSIKMDMARERNNLESMNELKSRRKFIILELQNEKDSLKRQHCKVIERIRQLVVTQLSKKRSSDLEVLMKKSKSLKSHNSTLESNKPNESVLSDSTENESRLIALSEMLKKQKANLEKLRGERIELDGDIVRSREEAKLKQLKAVTEDLRQLECEIKVIAENPNNSLVKPIIGKPRLQNRSISEDNQIVSCSLSKSSDIQRSCSDITAIDNSIEITNQSTGSTSVNRKHETVTCSLQNTNYNIADVLTLEAVKKNIFSSKSVSEVSDNIRTSEESQTKSLNLISSSISESAKLNLNVPKEKATTLGNLPDYEEQSLDLSEQNFVSSSCSSELKRKGLFASEQELPNITSICRPQPIGAEAASHPAAVSSKNFSFTEEKKEEMQSESISTTVPDSYVTSPDENTNFDFLIPMDEEGEKDGSANLEIESNSSCIPEIYFQRDLKPSVSSSTPTNDSTQSTLTSESDESSEKELNDSSTEHDLETSQRVSKPDCGDNLGGEKSLDNSFQTNINSEGNTDGFVADSIEFLGIKESFGGPDAEFVLLSEPDVPFSEPELEPKKDFESLLSSKFKDEVINNLELGNTTMYQKPESSATETTSHVTSYESKDKSDSVGGTSKCNTGFTFSALETSQADQKFNSNSSCLEPLRVGFDSNNLTKTSDTSIETKSSNTHGLIELKSSSPIPEIYFIPDEHSMEPLREIDINFNDEQRSESCGLHDTTSEVPLKSCSSRKISPEHDTHSESFVIDRHNDEKEFPLDCEAFSLSLDKSNIKGKCNQGSGTTDNEVFTEDQKHEDKYFEANVLEIPNCKESELKVHCMLNKTYEIVADHNVQKIKNDVFSIDERITDTSRSSDYELSSQKKLEYDILLDLEGPAHTLITSYSKDPTYVCRDMSSDSSNARNSEEDESPKSNRTPERAYDTETMEGMDCVIPKREQFGKLRTSAIHDFLLQKNILRELTEKQEEQEQNKVEKLEVLEIQQVENTGASLDTWDSSFKVILRTESFKNEEERMHTLDDQELKTVKLEQERVENLETSSFKQRKGDLDDLKRIDKPEIMEDELEEKSQTCSDKSDKITSGNSLVNDISQKALSEEQKEQELKEAEKPTMLENEQPEEKQAFADTFCNSRSPVTDISDKKLSEKHVEQRQELEKESVRFEKLEERKIEITQTNELLYDSLFRDISQKVPSDEQELDEEVEKLNKLEDEQAEKLDTSSDTFIINDSSSKEISPTESPAKQEIASLVSHVFDDPPMARNVNDRKSTTYFTTSYDVATSDSSSKGSPDHGEYNPQKEEVQYLDSKELISKLNKLENLHRDFDFESQWMDDDLLQSPLASAEEEAVALQKRQHKIDLEIQQLQGLSENARPTVPSEGNDNSSSPSASRLNGFFYREIPNKPPPPYTPPLGTTNPTFSCTSEIIPNSLEDFQSFIKMYCACIMEDNVSKNTGIEIMQCLFEINDEFLTEDELISRNSYAEFLCHLVDEAIYEIRNPSEYHPKYSYYKYLLTDNRAILKEAECVVLAELGLVQRFEKDNRALRWSLKTRDKVDEILVKELQSEGDEWNDLSHALRKVQNQLAEDLMNEFLMEIVAEINSTDTSSSKSVHV